MTNQQRKEAIDVLRKELKNLLDNCPHDIVESGSSAECDMCGEYFGLYCPDSPNHVCDYEQEDGSYDEDHCIYCGDPEERK